MTAPVMRKCPKCGKLKLERLIGTGAGVIFKGGGFYETDYRSDSYKKSAEAEKKAADTKPAAETGGDKGAKPAKAESSGKTTSESPKKLPAEKKKAKRSKGSE